MAFWTNTNKPDDGTVAGGSAAMSSDGSIIVSWSYNSETFTGYVQISENSGVTWTEKTDPGDKQWVSFAISDDGSVMIAAPFGGNIWTSDDTGVTWTEQTNSGVKDWSAVCCSSDGSIIYAVEQEALCYKSSDTGATWAATHADASSCRSIACSDDGTNVVVGGNPNIYISDDGGTSWTTVSPVGTSTFLSMACDSTATNIAGGDFTTGVWYSTNGGTSWTNVVGTNGGFLGAYASSDGSVLAVNSGSETGGGIVYSNDNGDTWGEYQFPFNLSAGNSLGDFFIGYGGTWYTLGGALPGELEFSITSITPNTGSTAGGTPVTIVGVGFDPAATAAIDGNDLTDVTVVDSTTITGITPAGTVGAKDVTVTNP